MKISNQVIDDIIKTVRKPNYYEQFEIELPYTKSGWLDTKGNFYKCPWGEHTSEAFDYINRNGWYKTFREHRQYEISCNGRDYLVKEKKWILIDNPTMNNRTQVVQYNPLTKHPKAQVNALLKLFDYNGDIQLEIMRRFE